MGKWREERIGDCRLILGDCLEVMPLLGKVDAVDSLDAVVYTEKYEKTAKRQRRSPEESGRNLGAEAGADHGPLRQWGHVAGGNGDDVQRLAAGLSESDFAHGNTVEGARPCGAFERAIYRRDAIDGLPADDQQGKMQPLRSDGSTGDPSPGSQSHEQHHGQLGSALQSMPFQPPQVRMVAFPEGWAILTDPPYGIGAAAASFIGTKKRKNAACAPTDYGHKDWDATPADMSWMAAECPAIVWGGNFLDLPRTKRWLVWDKCNDGMGLADCEIAWTNIEGAIRQFRHEWAGFRRGAEKGVSRVHPTQKPVALMEWCIGFLPDAETILDPFMGSGTTLVACAKLGRRGIGIELDSDYFDVACKRVEDAYRQPDLFIEPPKKLEQEAMDL